MLDVPWPTSTTDTVNYVGLADGVGSWRRVGVDPREFRCVSATGMGLGVRGRVRVVEFCAVVVVVGGGGCCWVRVKGWGGAMAASCYQAAPAGVLVLGLGEKK